MLSYETCLKLGATGFPLKIGPPTKNSFDLYALLPIPENWAAHLTPPTLSELIEACGIKFISLSLNPTPKNAGEMWVAVVARLSVEGYSMQRPGASPEEAVANAYLSLHK